MSFSELESLSANEVKSLFEMQPIEDEGAFWAPGTRNSEMNSILALITSEPDGFSAMHKLNLTEGWQWLAGAPLEMLQLHPGRSEKMLLDRENSQALVGIGIWQGAKTLGDWTLISCWCAPAFEYELFELGKRDELCALYPEVADLITELTRVN
jgi:predicted cupin superfamily sugar epimerase